MDEVKAHIDLHLKHYKRSQLVVPDDLLKFGKDEADVRDLYEYAVGKGISLRDDSPMVGWYVKKYMDTWTISHPQFYDPLYLKKPIVFELQHYGSVKDGGHWLGKNGADVIPSLGVSGAHDLPQCHRDHARHVHWLSRIRGRVSAGKPRPGR